MAAGALLRGSGARFRPFSERGARSRLFLLRGLASSNNRSGEDSWLKSLFVRKVDPRKDAHSNLLAKRETSSLYKLQFHNVKPECLDSYNQLCKEVLPKIHEGKEYPCTLVGTWNTWYGEQDQAVHLWRYEGGYPALTEVMSKLRHDKEFMEFRKARGNMLLSRRNQLLLEFSFWNEPVPRAGPNIYELRSYQLRPGTMIEWGNYWARAIRFRQDNEEAVGGFFSQIGQLYMVHHLWAYKDLQSREDTRNSAWHKPGWDELVYYTGNGIQNYDTIEDFSFAVKSLIERRLPIDLNWPKFNDRLDFSVPVNGKSQSYTLPIVDGCYGYKNAASEEQGLLY